MKSYIISLKDRDGEFLYWVYLFFMYVRKYHIFSLPIFLSMVLYSYFISIRLFGISIFPKVCFSSGLYRIRLIRSHKSTAIIIKGILIFEKWRSGVPTTITLGANSTLEILNTFVLGDNCKIAVASCGHLKICGKSIDQLSGITADSIILCSQKVEIGEGSIFSWNCYISDSSQHTYNGSLKVEPIVIGSHVWVSEGVTLAPGSKIGSGSVIGAKSFVKGEFPKAVFLAGSPAKIKSTDINWKR
ncbi:acyltransferase [Rheinheimera metallidurans]|uniref:acyltransferase n=1 Tax=Rheinheimera metallidurans TaxID=2925781 RepID=UPI0030031E53